MGVTTITQNLRAPVSEREQEVCSSLLAAVAMKDAETVQDILEWDETQQLIKRGVLSVRTT